MAQKRNSASGKTGAENPKVKVRALLNLQGRFLLPYDAKQEFLIDENQAKEMVELKYAEYVK